MPRIVLGHAILARWLGPEMHITEAEATELAKSYVEMRKHYGAIADPKTEAWINLFLVAGAIEGPRLMRVGERRKRERRTQQAAEAAKRNADSNVVQMPPGGFNGLS